MSQSYHLQYNLPEYLQQRTSYSGLGKKILEKLDQKQKEGPGGTKSREPWYPELRGCYYFWAVATGLHFGDAIMVDSGSTRIARWIRAEAIPRNQSESCCFWNHYYHLYYWENSHQKP